MIGNARAPVIMTVPSKMQQKMPNDCWHRSEKLAIQLLEFYPAVVWEDQDECLEVRPEDVKL